MHGGLLVTSEGVHSFTFLRRHGIWAIKCWCLEFGGLPLKTVSDMSNAELSLRKLRSAHQPSGGEFGASDQRIGQERL